MNVRSLLSTFCLTALVLSFSKNQEAFAQCPATFSVSNVKLNNVPATTITVQVNSTVTVNVDYNITNQTSCPGCFSQAVVGLEGTPIECLYSGTPALCPTGTSGNFSFNITAPSTPGVYDVNYRHTQEFSCDNAKTSYANSGRTQFATIVVCGAEDIITNVSLNGGGNNVSVLPGATVNMSLNYQVSNEIVFPTAIKQVVYGLENTALGCIYNGIPPTCPNAATGVFTTSFTAPTTPGNYAIYKNQHLQFNCTNAQALYPGVAKDQIGVVTVLPPLGVSVTYKVNVKDYVAAGATIGSTGLRIAGNFVSRGAKNGASPMPEWQPTEAASAMTQISDDIWQTTITYPDSSKGKIQLFKFVNGDWGQGNQEVSQELISCGDDDGFGAFNRVYIVPLSNRTIEYCWDRCASQCFGGSISGVVNPSKSIQKITFQPNPAKDLGILKFSSIKPMDVEFEVLDAQGKIVKSMVFAFPQSGDQAVSLPLQDMKNGFYVLRAKDGNGVNEVIRFVVAR